MKKVLRALYDGKICPAEQYYPTFEQTKEIRQRQLLHYHSFKQKLNELDADLTKQFEQIMDEQLDTVPFEYSEMFIDGFRLGARVMMEVFTEND